MHKIPNWAKLNTFLLIFPIVLGFGVFYLWFSPNPAMLIPSLALMALYYVVVMAICRKTSGVKSFRKANRDLLKKKSHCFYAILGLGMFSFSAYCGIYVTSSAFITSIFGSEVRKEFEVLSFYNPHIRRCSYRMELEGLSPAFNKHFCINKKYDVERGETVTLIGKESFLGFKFHTIKVNKAFKSPSAGTAKSAAL